MSMSGRKSGVPSAPTNEHRRRRLEAFTSTKWSDREPRCEGSDTLKVAASSPLDPLDPLGGCQGRATPVGPNARATACSPTNRHRRPRAASARRMPRASLRRSSLHRRRRCASSFDDVGFPELLLRTSTRSVCWPLPSPPPAEPSQKPNRRGPAPGGSECPASLTSRLIRNRSTDAPPANASCH